MGNNIETITAYRCRECGAESIAEETIAHAEGCPSLFPPTPVEDMTREFLVELCEKAIVPMDKWHDRDSAHSHEGLGRAWALLRAGAPFTVQTRENTSPDERCVTDDDTIWIEITWRGFQAFECGSEYDDVDTFYIPTPARLERRAGSDWY